ncbi:pyridoxine 4-dehydrogenase [Streptomyces aurantiacus]|uniref:aldo/keto reductase n=1 Tax=Streptomyces aurantiacus TaxID=47760 RepID=UPI0027901CB8|nr:aldo/keto reductase [Streptomyces aurantiacus]MDQ0778381.1 pyridoxine 4-dehydrogenase [Streptomyces aurantiacus]
MSAAPPGGLIPIAGKPVSRLGLGTMRLTGPDIWGWPEDFATATRVLREAVHVHGITHIDTADAYGPHTAETLIHTALHPYPPELLLATKVGLTRPAPDVWRPLGHPEYLRTAVEASLRRLDVERLDLCYLHRVDPAVPLEDQVGELRALQLAGKIGHIGLSKAGVDQIRAAEKEIVVAAVQNPLNSAEPNDPALGYCVRMEIPYVPYRPLNAGALPAPAALTWLLNLAPHIAPIPGTSSPEHLRALVAAVR